MAEAASAAGTTGLPPPSPPNPSEAAPVAYKTLPPPAAVSKTPPQTVPGAAPQTPPASTSKKTPMAPPPDRSAPAASDTSPGTSGSPEGLPKKAPPGATDSGTSSTNADRAAVSKAPRATPGKKKPPSSAPKTPAGASPNAPPSATPETSPAPPGKKSPPPPTPTAAPDATPAALSQAPRAALASKAPPSGGAKGPPEAGNRPPKPDKAPPKAGKPPPRAGKAAPGAGEAGKAPPPPSPSEQPPTAPRKAAPAGASAEAAPPAAPPAAAAEGPSPPPTATGGVAENEFQLHVSSIQDPQQLSRWEYWLQLSLFTTDLHIIGAWHLVSPDTEESFHTKVKASQGPTVVSFVDLDQLSPFQSSEDILQKQFLRLDCKSFIFSTGHCFPPAGFAAAPSGTFWFLACMLALGRVFSLDSHDQQQKQLQQTERQLQQKSRSRAVAFQTCEIPPHYGAVALKELLQTIGNSRPLQGPFRTLYRLRGKEQVLPVALVQFRMQPLRVQVVQPVCDLCEVIAATLYCPADKAHLCTACDERMHSSSRMLARHTRRPVAHSPYQFGACPYHPLEMIDTVCVTCSTALCPLCLLIGHHSATAVSGHQLLSTLDAYKLLIQASSPSEEKLEERKQRIARELRENHKQLGELHGNFLGVQRRIHEAAKNLLGQLRGMKERKTRYLLALKRELLSEMLLIEWLEASFAHLRLALSPSDFLVYKHKYDVAVTTLFEGQVRVNVDSDNMPPWMGEKVFLEGAFSVTAAPLAIPQLTTINAPADETLLQSFFAREKEAEEAHTGASSRQRRRSSPALQWEPASQQQAQQAGGAHPYETALGLSLPSEVEGLGPAGRVVAYQRVVHLPDKPGLSGDRSGTSTDGPPQSFPEYATSCKDAAPDLQQVPAAVREAVEKKRKAVEECDGTSSSTSMEDMQRMPREACSILWGLLSDNGCLPLLTLMKAADGRWRPDLIAAACRLANFFGALPDLIVHLIRFELEWVGHLPESLLLHTSSLLYPFLSHVATTRELLLPGNLAWLQQLLLPLLVAAEAYAEEQHISSRELVSDSPLKLLRPICVRFHDRLQSLTFYDIPPTFRGLLYLLAEAVDVQMRLSYSPGFVSADGASSMYTPPPAQNVVSAAAVAACAEALLRCVFAAFLIRHAPREQLGEPRSRAATSYTPPYAAVRAQSPLLDGSEADAATKLHTLAEALQRPPAYLAFDRMLRELAQSCWDPAVILQEGKEGGHLRVSSTQQGKARAVETHAAAATRSPFSPEDRTRLDMAGKVFRWCSSQLKLPRMHSPLLFNATGHAAAEQGAGTILRFVLVLDTMLREGSYRPVTPGLTEDVVASPAFEELLQFATRIGMYEHDVNGVVRLV